MDMMYSYNASHAFDILVLAVYPYDKIFNHILLEFFCAIKGVFKNLYACFYDISHMLKVIAMLLFSACRGAVEQVTVNSLFKRKEKCVPF
jgi:hypothetical protein